MAGYGISLRESKTEDKIRHYFIGRNLIVPLLCINIHILNCRYFHTHRSTSVQSNKRWKNKKTFVNAIYMKN